MRDGKGKVELPDLAGRNKISPDNLRAVQVIYVAAMLEELRLFQVVDRLAQLFQLGLLSLKSRSAGSSLYKYWKETPQRLTEVDRRNIYSSTLGIAGGSEGVAVNRDFNDLWSRFVSRIATFNRNNGLATALAETDELALRRSARELAENLSLHGWGVTFYAAVEISRQIKFYTKLLSDSEITSVYGARDMWQVIDQVATIDLGGAVNITRYRTMATTGGTIISWLAANAPKLQNRNSPLPFIKLRRTTNMRSTQSDVVVTAKPTDTDLVNACEQWLAASGVSDEQIDSFAKPRSETRGTSAN
jgi:hypothetical protein